MKIHVNEASEEHTAKGWVLEYHQLVDIQERLRASGMDVEQEIIEAILLASARKEYLIDHNN